MAEEEFEIEGDLEESFDAAPTAGSRSKLVTMLIYAAIGIVAIILMVLISYFIAKKVKNDSYKEDQAIVIAPPPRPLVTFPFKNEFRVNTADQDEAHFIQLKLNLGYKGKNNRLENELISRQAQMQHIINMILSGKKKEDVNTTLQKLNLADEIKSQINMILNNGKIEEVFFIELVIS